MKPVLKSSLRAKQPGKPGQKNDFKYDPKKDRRNVAFHKARKEAIEASMTSPTTTTTTTTTTTEKCVEDSPIDMSLFFSPMPEAALSATTATAAAAKTTTTTTPKSLTTTTTATAEKTTTPTTTNAAAVAVLGSTNEPMDLSTPHRFNKRSREKSPVGEKPKFAKKVIIHDEDENGVEEGDENDDIFNNEAMENPPDDVTVRFKMPAQRGSPDTSDPARFYVPAQNPANRIDENEMDEDGANNGESDGDEDMPGEVGEVGVELKVITRVWLLNAKLARNRSRTGQDRNVPVALCVRGGPAHARWMPRSFVDEHLP